MGRGFLGLILTGVPGYILGRTIDQQEQGEQIRKDKEEEEEKKKEVKKK